MHIIIIPSHKQVTSACIIEEAWALTEPCTLSSSSLLRAIVVTHTWQGYISLCYNTLSSPFPVPTLSTPLRRSKERQGRNRQRRLSRKHGARVRGWVTVCACVLRWQRTRVANEGNHGEPHEGPRKEAISLPPFESLTLLFPRWVVSPRLDDRVGFRDSLFFFWEATDVPISVIVKFQSKGSNAYFMTACVSTVASFLRQAEAHYLDLARSK